MTTTGNKRFLGWISLAVLIVILDQASKWAVVQWIPLYGKVPINDFINLTHQRNFGAAFSILADQSGWQRYFFVALASIVSIGIVFWMWAERVKGLGIVIGGLSLVLGGAVGNLVDRVRLGYVTDFIQVWFGSWPFPSFNVADAAISVGAALLIIDSIFISGRQPSAEQTAAPEKQGD